MRLTAHPVARDKGDIMRELNSIEKSNVSGGLYIPPPIKRLAKDAAVAAARALLKEAKKRLSPTSPQL